jgi:putative ABC transport system permease protein
VIRSTRRTGARSRLAPRDVWGLAAAGLGGRPVRTVLSAAGVALGVATMVAVLGISGSSRAQLVSEIDALGTNLLTVSPGQSFTNQNPQLPARAPAMVRRIGPVLSAAAIGEVPQGVGVYRNDRISSANTNGITVYTADPTLAGTVEATMARGRFLNAATAHLPAVVLGADAAQALGIDRVSGARPVEVDIARQWFSVVGVLDPVALAPELDRTALVGAPIGRQLLGSDGRPQEIYVRTAPADVDAVQAVLADSVDPAAPQNVEIANPTDALAARADAASSYESLLLALGAVALVVAGVGIANVMVIAVLERRTEIGLRRSLGATRIHIGVQFVAESALLAATGGAAGALLGACATTVYAGTRHWTTVIPPPALLLAVLAATAVGAVAGVYPAARAARLSPSLALRSV